MPIKYANLEGSRFGRLTVISETQLKNGRFGWLCKCDCGEIVSHPARRLISGNTQSCGCLKRQMVVERSTKHNLSHTRIYKTLSGMKDRCQNKKARAYVDYGGRGIKVCDEWLGENGVTNFYQWSMQNGYKKTLTIDRIDNNKGYSPDNCRWVSMKEQGSNKRNNRTFTYRGETKTLTEWSRVLGIKRETIRDRMDKLGYSFEEAIVKGDMRRR